MAFNPLFAPSDIKPSSQARKGLKASGATLTAFRDALPLPTWLAVGAFLHGILILTIGRIAMLLPIVFIFAKLSNALLMVYGFKPNPWMKDVINVKVSAQMPNDDGTFGPKPASKGVTVFILGAKSNHPLGLLAPGFKEMGEHFEKMNKEIEDRAEEYGMLGNSYWIGQERDSCNDVMTIMYFKDSEGLHRFAHDKMHREAWNWWNKTVAQHPYLSIWHEVYVAPPGHFESIYVNSSPTLLGGSSHPIKTSSGTKYFSSIVDASRGPLKSSKGRLQMTDGKDNDKYSDDPYDI